MERQLAYRSAAHFFVVASATLIICITLVGEFSIVFAHLILVVMGFLAIFMGVGLADHKEK
jgi:hypothetical protein